MGIITRGGHEFSVPLRPPRRLSSLELRDLASERDEINDKGGLNRPPVTPLCHNYTDVHYKCFTPLSTILSRFGLFLALIRSAPDFGFIINGSDNSSFFWNRYRVSGCSDRSFIFVCYH